MRPYTIYWWKENLKRWVISRPVNEDIAIAAKSKLKALGYMVYYTKTKYLLAVGLPDPVGEEFIMEV